MGRPQQKPQPRSQPPRSGLAVVEDEPSDPGAPGPAAAASQTETAADSARAAAASARKRLHPARVWPD